jgi:hypothetical protein
MNNLEERVGKLEKELKAVYIVFLVVCFFVGALVVKVFF